MKIRNGFVSNSSSSSFCIYGIMKDRNELIELIKSKNLPFEEEESIEVEIDGLEVIDDMDCEEVWIGRKWNSIKDDETGKAFKTEVENKIKEFGLTGKCESHDITISN